MCMCDTCVCVHVLTCPKPIGCCCWGWNAGGIFCGRLRRGVEWRCWRPGWPRPLDWHDDSKTEGRRSCEEGRTEKEMTCINSDNLVSHYFYHSVNKGRQKAEKEATRGLIQLQLQQSQRLWQEAYHIVQLCLITSKPLKMVAPVL